MFFALAAQAVAMWCLDNKIYNQELRGVALDLDTRSS